MSETGTGLDQGSGTQGTPRALEPQMPVPVPLPKSRLVLPRLLFPIKFHARTVVPSRCAHPAVSHDIIRTCLSSPVPPKPVLPSVILCPGLSLKSVWFEGSLYCRCFAPGPLLPSRVTLV